MQVDIIIGLLKAFKVSQSPDVVLALHTRMGKMVTHLSKESKKVQTVVFNSGIYKLLPQQQQLTNKNAKPCNCGKKGRGGCLNLAVGASKLLRVVLLLALVVIPMGVRIP